MTQYHAGQQVEVLDGGQWRKANIVAPRLANGTTLLLGIGWYDVKFADGIGIFDEQHIRHARGRNDTVS